MAIRLRIPDALQSLPIAEGPMVVVCCEPGVGELAIELFAAGLIIERDRILERMTEEAAEAAVAAPAAGDVRSLMPVELAEGPTGFIAQIDLARDERGEVPAYPYLSILVLAPPDLAVCGGAIVTVRSAALEWDASADMLASLRLGDTGVANDSRGALPLVGWRR